ncbi:MAG: glycosyltransferase [Bacteroidota bacterium]
MGDRLIIYDSFSGGHHPEFVRLLLENWPPNSGGKSFTKLLLHPKIVAELKHISLPERVELVELPQVVTRQLAEASNHKEHILIERAFLLDMVEKYKPTDWLWLAIDAYRTFLSRRPFKKYNVRHRGILFMNHLYRPWKLHNTREQLALRYKLGKMLRNQSVEKVFVLNDDAGAVKLNKQYKENRFISLPEPIAGERDLIKTSEERKSAFKEELGWPLDKKIALLFGVLAPRKNPIGCIEALKLLPSELQKNYCLVIHGSISNPPSLEQEVHQAIEETNTQLAQKLSTSSSPPFVLLQTGRVIGQELEKRFAACDIVLAPYVNFYSASGVMNHAIQHGKTSVVPHRGLMASLSESYQFNEVCIADQPKDIARAWGLADKRALDLNKAMQYLASRTPAQYAKTLLE